MDPERWKQVRNLLESALDLPADERDAFLENACGGDRVLREEVSSLIARAGEAEGLLENEGSPDTAHFLIGQTLSHYQILSQEGRGGMGIVYRARDTKLGREVAVKVLPKDFVEDRDRLARFEREARVLAALNHPGIATVHEIDHVDGLHFLVMELIGGETLAERIARRPLPVAEALPLFKQIAEALEAAHGKGIVHRDLKPDNIKISPEGKVTVLDFGLAKALVDEASSSPGFTPHGTEHGVILGTASYMSPEQARGKPVDERTDIWSFGCVLFEALTGRLAFEGETRSDTIAAILGKEPPWNALPASTPTAVRTLLRWCLRGDRDRRLHDIADARIAIDDATHEPSDVDERVSRAPTRAAWLLGLAAALSLMAVVLLLRPAPDARELRRLSILAPEGTFLPYAEPPAISPDGTQVAFVVEDEAGDRQIWLRPLESSVARPLSGTDGGSYLFWSPDSRSLGFFASGALNRIDLASGVVRRLTDAEQGRGGTWSRDGVIIFAPKRSSALYRVSADGGAPEPVTTLKPEHFSHRMPQFLPDGRRFLYYCTCDGPRLWVGSLDTGVPDRNLGINGWAVYAPPGLLVYVRDGWLTGHRFDPERAVLEGEPVTLTESAQHHYDDGDFSVSATGVLIYIDEFVSPLRQLAWYDRDGSRLGTVGTPGFYGAPLLSKDDTKIAFHWKEAAPDPTFDVWVLDIAEEAPRQLTTGPKNDWFPIWSPDSESVLFSSTYSRGLEPTGLYRKAVGSDTPAEQVLTSEWDTVEGVGIPSDWTGQYIVYFKQDREKQRRDWDIWALPLSEPLDRAPRLVVRTDGQDLDGKVSPDGRWIAYVSNVVEGKQQIYLQRFPADTSRLPVSVNGGVQPRWRADGKELFFRTLEGAVLSVDIELGREIHFSQPRFLFQTRMDTPNTGAAGFDVTSGGQRFIVNEPTEPFRVREIHVVENWDKLVLGR